MVEEGARSSAGWWRSDADRRRCAASAYSA